MLNLARRVQVTPQQLDEGLSSLGLSGAEHLIVHSSLRSFGTLEGGADTLLRGLERSTATLVAPAFSYQTLVRGPDSPIHAQFHRDTRVSRDIGRLSQTMVERAAARRSFHPALSFVALGEQAEAVVASQTLDNPYAPIGTLYDLDGYALLAGVDHSSNTSIHYGEYLAGVPLLTRYVALGGRVTPCAFPNCSADFDRIAAHVHPRTVQVGRSRLRLYRVRELVDVTVDLLGRDPEALLCTYPSCRCQQVRQMVRQQGLSPRAHASVTVARGAPLQRLN
ncbi:AAC(3) family N-acetyltransferase [Deinococcus aquiradiocola]|uniref:Aminoglycoside N(3)-acetyltransferase n=1 Tax=Deinococcus aquiradiocola TaxID=393059 RepID=A0A917USC0_9DEIO|nr:AAC(3) family N-acetyltransferase [Deinococcus aquiradiocola]GGJ82299.1 AAC(3) family N-acetyltransferase [Deinococcus aquiradiocola]